VRVAILVVAVLVAGIFLLERSLPRASAPTPAQDPPEAQESTTSQPVAALPSRTADSPAGTSADPAAAVAATFEVLRSGILLRNGRIAASAVTEETLHYYDEIASMALSAEKPIVASQSLLTQLLILNVRTRVSSAQLRELNGRHLFEYAVEHGLTGREIGGLGISDISVFDATASAKVVEGECTGLTLEFHREADEWKLSLIPVLEFLDRVLADGAARAGLSREEFVNAVMASESGASPPWNPPG